MPKGLCDLPGVAGGVKYTVLIPVLSSPVVSRIDISTGSFNPELFGLRCASAGKRHLIIVSSIVICSSIAAASNIPLYWIWVVSI